MSRAAGPFTPRRTHAVTHHELWYRYVPESGNWHGGTLTRRMVALSAAPLSFIQDDTPIILDLSDIAKPLFA